MAKRALRADSSAAVRASLLKVANELRRGELLPAQANAIVYALNCVLQSLRLDVQQAKLDELEKVIADMREGRTL